MLTVTSSNLNSLLEMWVQRPDKWIFHGEESENRCNSKLRLKFGTFGSDILLLYFLCRLDVVKSYRLLKFRNLIECQNERFRMRLLIYYPLGWFTFWVSIIRWWLHLSKRIIIILFRSRHCASFSFKLFL